MSITKKSCVLCFINDRKKNRSFTDIFGEDREHLELIASKSRYNVVHDLAPIVEGHFLVISKSHVTSLAQMTKKELIELSAMQKELSVMVKENYGYEPVWFEHGECRGVDSTSCKVHHAHLHGVPAPKEIFDPLKGRYSFQEIDSIIDLNKFDLDQPYLFIQTEVEQAWFIQMDPPSQFLRQAACEFLGFEERWNWHKMIKENQASNKALIERGITAYADFSFSSE